HDTRLETRAARARLRPRKKPYYKTLVPGRMALGYHRKRQHTPGRWLVRVYLGNEVYRITSLGIADDFTDAASGHVLSYAEAQSAAVARKTDTRRHDGVTVEDATAAHVEWMHVDRPTAAAEFDRTAECHILPRLGAIPLAALTTAQLVQWRDALVAAPAYHAR